MASSVCFARLLLPGGGVGEEEDRLVVISRTIPSFFALSLPLLHAACSRRRSTHNRSCPALLAL
eukprot:2025256-Rhodomonas_salina.2